MQKKMSQKLAMGSIPPSSKKGYTKGSGSKAAIRNCKAVGGKMVNGKCVGGAA